MIRGHPPYVAICEAVIKAEKNGMIAMVFENGQDLPVHLVLCDGPCVSFVRVRRMKYPRFSVKDIEAACRNDIALLREISVTDEIFRELWVRGPDRRWHRYLVLPDAIEELDGFDDDGDEKPAEGKVPPSPPVFRDMYRTGQEDEEPEQRVAANGKSP